MHTYITHMAWAGYGMDVCTVLYVCFQSMCLFQSSEVVLVLIISRYGYETHTHTYTYPYLTLPQTVGEEIEERSEEMK